MNVSYPSLLKIVVDLGHKTAKLENDSIQLVTPLWGVTTIRIHESERFIKINTLLTPDFLEVLTPDNRPTLLSLLNFINASADLYCNFYLNGEKPDEMSLWAIGKVPLWGPGDINADRLAPVLYSCLLGAEQLFKVLSKESPHERLDVNKCIGKFIADGPILREMYRP